MKVKFEGANAEQESLWLFAIENLLNLPPDAIPLTATIPFVKEFEDIGDTEGTPFAETIWGYDVAEGEIRVRKDAPGFGDSDAGLIAEALGMGLIYDARLHFHETAAHETGHAIFAAIGHEYRLKIAQMFGAKTDDKDELQPSGKEWKKRIGEAIAETFKEAFLPARYRVFPNRTDIKLSYAEYPRFRRLIREGLEAGVKGVEEEVPTNYKLRYGGIFLTRHTPNYETWHGLWRPEFYGPPTSHEGERLDQNGWISDPAKNFILSDTFLKALGYDAMADFEVGVSREGYRHCVGVIEEHPEFGLGWEDWRQGVEEALENGVKAIKANWMMGPQFVNKPGYEDRVMASGEIWPNAEEKIELWKPPINPEDFEEHYAHFSKPMYPGFDFHDLPISGLQNYCLGQFNPVDIRFAPQDLERGPEYLENPEIKEWESYFSHLPTSEPVPENFQALVNLWAKLQFGSPPNPAVIGKKFNAHYKFYMTVIWAKKLAPSKVSDYVIGEKVGPFEDDFVFEVVEWSEEKERYLVIQLDPIGTTYFGEGQWMNGGEGPHPLRTANSNPATEWDIPEDALYMAGLLHSSYYSDTWEEEVLSPVERFGVPWLGGFELILPKTQGGKGAPGVPISVPLGEVMGMGQRNTRVPSRGRVQGHR